MDTNLSVERRLEVLEEQLNRVSRLDPASRSIEAPLLAALGTILEEAGERDRAAPWLQRAHKADPWDPTSFARLIKNLWDRERWGEAVAVVEKQLRRAGEVRGLIYAHGRSLFEAGSVSRAVPRLRQAYELHHDQPKQQQFIFSLLERAVTVAGAEAPPEAIEATSGLVALDDAKAAISEFAGFVSAEKRMRFWTHNQTKGRAWRERPEQYAQDLLHTYLQGRFVDRAEILEEIPAGSGRIDLLIRFMGGLTVMVELKMCGLTYSSSYAAAGEEQLAHYMANRQTHLGFLVVLDGRIRDYGRKVLAGVEPSMTIEELFIDVRPERAHGL